MTRAAILACIGILFVHSAAWTAPAGEELKNPAQALEIRLISPDFPIFPEDFIPLKVMIKNVGRDTLTLLFPLDGHEMGWRAVRYTWTSSDPKVILDRYKGGFCGTVNTLTEKDFFNLAPGEKIEYNGGVAFLQAKTVGECEVTLTYEFDPKRPDRGLGDDPKLNKRLQEATPLKVTSAPLKVRVRPWPVELAKDLDTIKQIGELYNKASQVESQAFKAHQEADTPEQKKTAYEALQMAQKEREEIQKRLDQAREAYQKARADYVKRWQDANR